MAWPLRNFVAKLQAQFKMEASASTILYHPSRLIPANSPYHKQRAHIRKWRSHAEGQTSIPQSFIFSRSECRSFILQMTLSAIYDKLPEILETNSHLTLQIYRTRNFLSSVKKELNIVHHASQTKKGERLDGTEKGCN